MAEHKHQVVIVGGGTAGLMVASRLRNADANLDLAIIEPSDKHYYQPIWTLVGAGLFDKEGSERDEADFIPDDVTWLRTKVSTFEPDENRLTLEGGDVVHYTQLVVGAGIQLDWAKIKGLNETLGKDGVSSNYSYKFVDKTWDFLKAFRGGNALFTFPSTPIKCAGAPQKIMWLAEEHFRNMGIRDKSHVHYTSATAGIFGIPRYKKVLQKLAEERGIEPHYRHNLVEIRSASKEAVFENLDGGDELILPYAFMHVTPPQSAPDFIKVSPLAGDKGWVSVDKHTLQHTEYENVFSLGDCSSLPCSKTGAAIRKQAPVLVENLLALRGGRTLPGSYDGYASCPLVTGKGTVVMAEFGYDGKIMETFPFSQAKERFSMYALKAYALPDLYWHGMLKGRM
jgi:sulfide:quinone oxidoreductase